MMGVDGQTLRNANKERRQERVYSQLKLKAVNFHFRPGQHLAIPDLCSALRVSNTPVREALIRLNVEKLVTAEPTRGFYARFLDLDEMQDLLDLASQLTLHSLRTAIRPFPSETIRRSSALALQSRARASRVLKADAENTAGMIEDILIGIASMSSNRTTRAFIDNICDRTHYVRVWDIRLRTNDDPLIATISHVLDAMNRGDHELAEELITARIRVQIGDLPKTLSRALTEAFR